MDFTPLFKKALLIYAIKRRERIFFDFVNYFRIQDAKILLKNIDHNIQ